MYADGTNQDICLDIVAQQLSVERRRIYDIVNVFEGLELICRKAKNLYTWYVFPLALGTLKRKHAAT